MNVKFSRHAKRRAKLYKIPETILSYILKNMKLSPGEHEIIKHVEGFELPLKNYCYC